MFTRSKYLNLTGHLEIIAIEDFLDALALVEEKTPT